MAECYSEEPTWVPYGGSHSPSFSVGQAAPTLEWPLLCVLADSRPNTDSIGCPSQVQQDTAFVLFCEHSGKQEKATASWDQAVQMECRIEVLGKQEN